MNVTAVPNIKLRRCPDCSRYISKSASKCVHCGRSFTRWGKMLAMLILIIVALVFLVITSETDRLSSEQRAEIRKIQAQTESLERQLHSN